MSRPLVALLFTLALAACSDDGDKPGIEAGAPDGPVVDRSPGSDIAVPDAAVPDQAVDTRSPDTSSTSPSGWTEVMTAPNQLTAVWAKDANTAYIVGLDGTILSYNGATWASMVNTEKDDLYGIWGNASKVWAAGMGGEMAWDGSAWTKITTSTSYTFVDLKASATNLYAPTSATSIYYKTQSSTSAYWSSIYLSSVLSSKTIQGLWVLSDNQIMAVGTDGLILQCTATCTSSSSWKAMTSGTTTHLNAVWGSSATDVFAVGLDGTVLHYDGTAWSKMTTGTATYFYDVWGTGPDDVWAVGHPIFKADESIFHYDGTSWTKTPPPKTSFLNAVHGSGTKDVWAVGKSNILHFTGKP